MAKLPSGVSDSGPAVRAGRRGPAVPWRRARKAGRRLSWGVADQAMSSISNFAVNIYIARTLGAVQYGAFSLAYVTYAFALNASRGLATDPLLVRFSGTDVPTWRRAAAGCTGTAATVGLAAGACVLAVAALLGGTARLAFLALGLTLPGLLLQDSWRFAFFALGRGGQALLNDTVWVVALLPALVLLRKTGHPGVFWFVLAWGASGTVAAAVGPLQARVVPRLSAARSWLSRHRDLGPRYLAEGTANSAAAQLRNYGIGLILGLAAVGYVQAASTLMGPFMVVFFGMGLVTLPEAARLWRNSPQHMPAFCALYSTALALLGLAWGVVLLVVLPHGFGHWLLGSVWRPTAPLVLPLTISIVGGCLASGAGTGLHALGAARRSLRAMIIASALSVAGALAGAMADGAVGTVRGLAVATWLGTLVFWRELRAALRESEVFSQRSLLRPGRPAGRHRTLAAAVAGAPRRSRRPAWLLVAGCSVLTVALIGTYLVWHNGGAGRHPVAHGPAPRGDAASGTSLHAQRVCGQPVLRSPYSYHGAAGAYPSGRAGLPTYGTPHSDFPQDTGGMVLPAGRHSYASYQLRPDTVYYLLPGTHIGGFQADSRDAFAGGQNGRIGTVLSGDYSPGGQAIDSNSTAGNQPGVVIEYLTIEKFEPHADAAAINQEANTNWIIRYDTIKLNVPGAGVIAGAGNLIKDNCLTLNGQYGFQSTDTDGFGRDSLTGGPYNVSVVGNEISHNDTCDFSGLLRNPAIGWSRHDPVPPRYRNPRCGPVVPNGDQGGFKLWQTNGVTVKDNYIHSNWGPGAWVDTDNANTTFTGNVITGNEGEGIIEEVSYNFAIRDNYLADNGWTDGLANAGFPVAAIYISESGSDTAFGGVPGCRERSCRHQRSYRRRSVISGNIMVNNSGNVFLWQSADRYCGDGYDDGCTLVNGGSAGPFTEAGCRGNFGSAAISTPTFAGRQTGSPAQDWWDGCLWRTENVRITRNIIEFNPADIPDCNRADWPDCGAGGIFGDYSSTAALKKPGGWVIPTQLTFFQHDTWSGNSYYGPSTFYAWNQGNGGNPVSWAAWTGGVSDGDKCGSPGERSSGYCTGPFGRDAGSTYSPVPPAVGSAPVLAKAKQADTSAGSGG